MEFKDKLKTIRKEKGLSQQALADTEEVQEVLVAKNKNISILWKTILVMGTILILVTGMIFTYLILFGGYNFTPEMVAKNFTEYECIELEDYDIYWRTITEPEEMACIDLFTPVKKTFIGCFIREDDKKYKEVFCNGNRVAILYSIEGKDGYYNILKKGHTVVGFEDGVGETSFFSALSIVDNLQINNKDIEVKYNSFFITEDEVTEFSIGEYNFVVDDEEYFE